MKENIIKKSVEIEKITTISNWSDASTVLPVDKENNELFERVNISRDKFNVVYAGNFGKAQGAHVVLQAAEIPINLQIVNL